MNRATQKRLSMRNSNKAARYLENLRAILDGARQEYQQETIDWRNAQLAHLRNYMWVAATLFAFESGLALGITFPGKGISLPWDVAITPRFYVLAAAAIFFCVLAFMLALDTCRGRGAIKQPCDRSWTAMSTLAWDEKEGVHPAGTTLRVMIASLEEACREHQKQNGGKGARLRVISVLLLASVVLTAFFIIP